MARPSAANPGSRSQQAGGAVARDPWEDAAAALRSRDSTTPTNPWGTGIRQSTEPPITDTWATGSWREAPVMDTWGPWSSTVAPVTDHWGARASTEAQITQTWGRRASESWWASSVAPVTDGWGTMASTEAPDTNFWGSRASREAPVTDCRGTMASADAPDTGIWGPRASESARGALGRITPERSRFTAPPPSESEVMLMNITVGNAKAFLHCGICRLPLKPPIFQCGAGHAVCFACRDEPLCSGSGRTCNMSIGPGYYRRCRILDSLVESLRVACPNAARGCDATPAYYDLRAHRAACAHAPGTRCPVRGCSFIAPMAELLEHFTAVHGWPHTAEERVGKSFDVDLCDGFNVVATAVRDGGNQQHLLLLNVARQPFGRTVSAVCVHPQPGVDVVGSSEAEVTKKVELELRYWAAHHYQESQFSVPFVDLTDGLQNHLAQFVLPKSVHADDEATITVTAFLTIK